MCSGLARSTRGSVNSTMLSESLSWIRYQSNRVIHDCTICLLVLTAEAVILKQLVFEHLMGQCHFNRRLNLLRILSQRIRLFGRE